MHSNAFRFAILCGFVSACQLGEPARSSDSGMTVPEAGPGYDLVDSGPPRVRDGGTRMDAASSGDAQMDAAAPVLDAQMDSGMPMMDAQIADAAQPNMDAQMDAAVSGDAQLPDAAHTPDAAEDAGTPRTDGCPDDAPLPLTRVRIRAAVGQEAQLVGARIQGSLSGPTTDFVDLATVTQAPGAGAYAELSFDNNATYRYLRYYAPPSSQGGLAEIAFYYGNTRLSGAAFGTVSTDPAHGYALALDGDINSYFVPDANGGGYVGLDIARGYVTQPVTFTPGPASSATPIAVGISSGTQGAIIRYTTDGSDPTRNTGAVYQSPIDMAQGRTELRVRAFASCRFDTAVSTATYVIGGSQPPVTQGLTTYHIGNSLTDTINPWLRPIADSTGVTHTYARWTIPGAPIKWIAEHEGTGFSTPDGATVYSTFVQSYAPIDHLSLQPYGDPDFESQGAAAVSLMMKALVNSPNIQFWIYAQWPGRTEWTTGAFSQGYSGWQIPHPATTWEEAVDNHMLYHETFRDYVDPSVPGKPILIVPGGLALKELKRQMDAGSIAGLSDFFNTMFEDEEHLRVPAQYLVSLVFYSCLYRQSPEGRVTYSGTGLTQEQALALQRIAWNVASNYPDSGISN